MNSASAIPTEDQSASAFDDGGPVDDSNETTGAIPETPPEAGPQPNTPDAQANDEGFNQKVKDAGKAIYEGVMSVPQYLSLLMGKSGQYDQIWNNSTVRSITEAAKSTGQALNTPLDSSSGAQPPMKGRGASNPMMQGGLPGIGEGAGPDWGETGKTIGKFGRALAQNFGADGEPVETPQPTAGGAATQQAQPSAAQQAQPSAAQQAQPAAPQGGQFQKNLFPAFADPQQIATAFKVDPSVVEQAMIRHPSASERGQMLDFVAAHADAATKQKWEMEKVTKQSEWHIPTAQARGSAQMALQQLKGDQSQRLEMSKELNRLAIQNMKVLSDQDKIMMSHLNSITNAMGTPDDNLAKHAAALYERLSGGGDGSQGPIKIPTKGNPNSFTDEQGRTWVKGPDGKAVRQ